MLLQQEGKKKTLSIKDVLQILSGKGRPLVLILLCLPFCQPIQIPGLSFPFGLAIAFIGLRMIFGKRLWLPQKLLSKEIPDHVLSKITEKTLKLTRKIKQWVHPRLIWLSNSSAMEKGNGLMIVVLGLLLALPLPIPLSNLTAAWSILFISFGLIENDGLFIIIGYLITLLTLIFFLAIVLSITTYLYM